MFKAAPGTAGLVALETETRPSCGAARCENTGEPPRRRERRLGEAPGHRRGRARCWRSPRFQSRSQLLAIQINRRVESLIACVLPMTDMHHNRSADLLLLHDGLRSTHLIRVTCGERLSMKVGNHLGCESPPTHTKVQWIRSWPLADTYPRSALRPNATAHASGFSFWSART